MVTAEDKDRASTMSATPGRLHSSISISRSGEVRAEEDGEYMVGLCPFRQDIVLFTISAPMSSSVR